MCAKFRVKRSSLERAKKDLDAFMLEKKKKVSVALAFWADDTVGEIQQELHSVGAFDQGILSAATTRDPVKVEGSKIRVKIHNDLEYASVVEFGRSPGSGAPPPLLPLVGWARRKGIISRLPVNIHFGGEWAKYWSASAAIFWRIRNRKGRAKKKSKSLDPIIGEILTVRAIANKIFEKGTKGRRPFSKVHDRRALTITKEIAALLRLRK